MDVEATAQVLRGEGETNMQLGWKTRCLEKEPFSPYCKFSEASFLRRSTKLLTSEKLKVLRSLHRCA